MNDRIIIFSIFLSSFSVILTIIILYKLSDRKRTKKATKAYDEARSFVLNTAQTIYREKDFITLTLIGDIRVVEGVLYKFLQTCYEAPIEFEREEVNSGTIHYKLIWAGELSTRMIDVWLRLGYDGFTFILWKMVEHDFSHRPDHPGSRMLCLTHRKFFALFEFFYYVDQLRMTFLTNSNKHMLVEFSNRMRDARDLYNQYDEEDEQATREFLHYLEEEESTFDERMEPLLLNQVNEEQRKSLQKIMSHLPSELGTSPPPRGRRSEKDYDEIYQQHVGDDGTITIAVRELEKRGYSKDAASAAMKRRRKAQRTDEGRNSDEGGRNSFD